MKSLWYVKYTVFLLVSLLSIFLFVHSSFFYIDKITVQGADKLGAEEVIALRAANRNDTSRSMGSKSAGP